jgi:beta-galactosidase
MRFIPALLLLCSLSGYAAERTTISLDGLWDLTDSKTAGPFPVHFDHKAPVPGLAHSSTRPFVDVDLFDSRQVIQNRVSRGELPSMALVRNAGVPRQARNWFWYHRTFEINERRRVAILRIKKAQFGAAVWLNGKKLGEHLPCFSAAIFDVTNSIRWNGRNDLIVRVGAHPGVLPESISAGTDFEKNRWTPGIYDSVSLQLSDNPTIETIQIAPRLADSSIVVQTKLRNHGETASRFKLTHNVHVWKSSSVVVRYATAGYLVAAWRKADYHSDD